MTKKIYLETFKGCARSLCFPLLEKGFAVTKFLIKIISLDSFDMTVTNRAYFTVLFGYSRMSAISRNSGRCEVLDVFLCDTDI